MNKIRIKSIKLSNNEAIITVCDTEGTREATTNLEKFMDVLSSHKANDDLVNIDFNGGVIYQDGVSQKGVLAEIIVKDKLSNICIKIKEDKLYRINDILSVLERALDCTKDKGIDINIIRNSNSSSIDLDIKSKRAITVCINEYIDTLITRGVNIGLVDVSARHVIIECNERIFCGNINCDRLDIRLKQPTKNNLLAGVSARRVTINCYDSNDAIQMCHGVISRNPKIESIRVRADSLGIENTVVTNVRMEGILKAVYERDMEFIINKCIREKLGDKLGVLVVDENELIKIRQRAHKLGTKTHIIGISDD